MKERTHTYTAKDKFVSLVADIKHDVYVVACMNYVNDENETEYFETLHEAERFAEGFINY